MHERTRRGAVGLTVGAALLLTGCGAGGVQVPDPPAQGNVLDTADVLSGDQERALSALIDEHNADTDAARVAVLTVPEADGSIEDYAQEVATAWGVGDDGAGNGVLVVAATQDRELRIEVADGAGERFSDDEAQDVVDDVLGPAFADGRYAQGLTGTVDAVYAYAQGQEPAEEPFNWIALAAVVGGVLLVAGLVVAWIAADGRRRRRIAEDEIRAAEQEDPDLRLTDEQRKAYEKYRYSHRGGDAVSNPAVWLPLYVANPALYSGGSSSTGGDGSAGGSSFGGGGGFSGGGASGGY